MRYVAFLRAINVGGHVVRMDRLRQLMASLGLQNVETFIASGNVVFDSSSRTPARLEAAIEKGLEDALGYRVATFLRTLPELAEVAAHQPFPADDGTLYVAFLRAAPPADAVRRVRALSTPVDSLDVVGRELYWQCRASFSETTVGGGVLEKILGGEATLRNINTVRRISARWGGTARAG